MTTTSMSYIEQVVRDLRKTERNIKQTRMDLHFLELEHEKLKKEYREYQRREWQSSS